jgi:DNA-binding CsgD family transcriptional regulator
VSVLQNGRPATVNGLLERDRELAALDGLLERAVDGGGVLVVVEGAPGIGKTSLLRAASALAVEQGLTLYRATGVELERTFPWGVARQLFERPLAELAEVERTRVLAGVAGLCGDLLLSAPPVPTAAHAAAEDPFAAVHALYWLCANLADDRPALVAVDDVQWADEPTLRFLAYLATRIGELPLVLVLGTRPPDAGSGLLRALARDPEATRLAPAPLSTGAVGALIERACGEPPDEEFVRACHESTGGNPFLLATLADALADERTRPARDAVPRAWELGSRALSETVVYRMLRLSDEARRLARAVAVLAPEDARLAAALAELDPQQAAGAGDALAAEHVVCPERPLRFVHPLVRSAVAATMPPGERDLMHTRAADLLRAEGAPPERVAGHWLLATPANRSGAVAELREAARLASERGAPDAALRYLRRALEEPPPPGERGELLGELGAVELRLALEVGERHLRQALATAPSGRRYAELARELRMPLFAMGRHAEGAELFRDARERLGDSDRELALKLRADEVGAVRFAYGRGADLRDVLDLPGATPGERGLLAVAAFERTIDGGGAEEVAAIASRASADAAIVEESDEYVHLALLIYAMLAADRCNAAERLNQAALERARQRSQRLSTVTFSWTAAMIAHRRGALAAAQAEAERAVAGASEWKVEAVLAKVGSTLIDALVDRGRLSDARAALDRLGGHSLPRGFIANWLRYSRARLRLAVGDAGGARADLEELLESDAGWRGGNPACYPLRSTLALALRACGEPKLAHRRAVEELELARRWGASTAIGVALRAVGLCEPGESGVRALHDSTRTLANSPARLEQARSWIELGAAIRRSGRPTDAREPLLTGLDLAERCGAEPAAERAREELRAAGMRPRRSALRGVEALTPSELRVARLAAEGLTNREIAQALFVTLSTVEVHLTHAYQKLSISARKDLPAALEDGPREPTEASASHLHEYPPR